MSTKRKAKAKIELLDGLFIDPFRKEVRRVQVARDLDTWYKLLYCRSVECACLAESPNENLDLWFDDEFLFREPRLPAFKLKSAKSAGMADYIIHGYALVLASNRAGESVSLSSSKASVEWFLDVTDLAFENWHRRLTRSDFFIPQMLRMVELELPERFKYLP
jgi:hypothetical protein